MKTAERTCDDCRFAVYLDYGYSSYTVEGTEFVCSEDKHPDGVFDRWYGEDKKLDHAEQCVTFTVGEPIQVDVDREEAPTENDGEEWDIYQAALALHDTYPNTGGW